MPPETRPKSLTVGYLAPARNLDPRTAWDVESSFVIRHVFEAPFGNVYGSTEIEPCLFSGPLQGRDARGTVFEAQVRPGVLFSDGSPLRTEDVVRCLRASPSVREEAEVKAEGDRVVFIQNKIKPE